MGTYYDVDKVKSSGRKLNSKNDRLSNYERLVMVLDGTIHNMAVDVTSPSEFYGFYGQYSMGYWLSYELYAYTPTLDTV